MYSECCLEYGGSNAYGGTNRPTADSGKGLETIDPKGAGVDISGYTEWV